MKIMKSITLLLVAIIIICAVPFFVYASEDQSNNVSISENVPPPGAYTPQQFVYGATVSYLIASGTNIQWYDDYRYGEPLSPDEQLVDGKTYYASQTVGGIVSSSRTAVTVMLRGTATVPGAPVIGTATAGDGQATITFTPPISDGGLKITRYTVTSSPGGFMASSSSSPITIAGLTNGTNYTFTVMATNSIGTGAVSAPSNSVIPTASTPVTYDVTVNNSYAGTTGEGRYTAGATVIINAGVRSSHSFNGWATTSNGVIFANAGSAITTFTMPANVVTVTVNWTQNTDDDNTPPPPTPVPQPPPTPVLQTTTQKPASTLTSVEEEDKGEIEEPEEPEKSGESNESETSPPEDSTPVVSANTPSDDGPDTGIVEVTDTIEVIDSDYTSSADQVDENSIYDDGIPLRAFWGGSGTSHHVWALLNLVLCIEIAILTLKLFIRLISRKKQNKKIQNEFDMKDNSKKQYQHRLLLIIIIPVLAIIGCVLFILTNNIALMMVIMDWWSFLYIVIFAVSIICYILVFKRPRERGDGAYVP